MALPALIDIEVAYARPEEQVTVALSVPVGTTVAEAVELAGFLRRFPEIDLRRNRLGVFGELTSPDRLVQEHDRVEIYRPLYADPRELRRQRMACGGV